MDSPKKSGTHENLLGLTIFKTRESRTRTPRKNPKSIPVQKKKEKNKTKLSVMKEDVIIPPANEVWGGI